MHRWVNAPRTALASIGLVACTCQHVLAQTPRWITVFDTSARYYGWSNSIGGSGTQVYVPYAVQTTGRPNDDLKAEFLVRSGYIWSQQKSNGVTAVGQSLTDTTLASTVTYYGWNGIHPFASININAPTAKTSSGSSSTTRIDSDLVATPIFGEGWNIGPSIGASFAIDLSLIATLSYGYVYRGPFDEGPSLNATALNTPSGKLNPGDVSTLDVGLGYSGDRFTGRISVSYSTESRTYDDGMPLYQAGDRVIVTGKGGYAWTDNWSSRVAGSFSHFNHNNVPLQGVPDLVREALNSNSDVYRVAFDTTYASGNFSIGPTGAYLWRDHNGYDPTNLLFIPAKVSWSAGAAADIAPTATTSISLSVQHIWVHENATANVVDAFNLVIANSGIPESSTNAWVATVGGSVRF